MIYHLAMPESWEAAVAQGSYDRSTREQSLAEVGYVHCSTAAQVPATAARFYADVPEVVLLTVDEADLDVRWEPAHGELFPHVHGPIPVASVVSARRCSPQELPALT